LSKFSSRWNISLSYGGFVLLLISLLFASGWLCCNFCTSYSNTSYHKNIHSPLCPQFLNITKQCSRLSIFPAMRLSAIALKVRDGDLVPLCKKVTWILLTLSRRVLCSVSGAGCLRAQITEKREEENIQACPYY
jgi:hypothetical protein